MAESKFSDATYEKMRSAITTYYQVSEADDIDKIQKKHADDIAEIRTKHTTYLKIVLDKLKNNEENVVNTKNHIYPEIIKNVLMGKTNHRINIPPRLISYNSTYLFAVTELLKEHFPTSEIDWWSYKDDDEDYYYITHIISPDDIKLNQDIIDKYVAHTAAKEEITKQIETLKRKHTEIDKENIF